MVKLRVKTIQKTVDKWVTEAPKRLPYYELEAPAAADYWFEKATAAEKTYRAGVTAPAVERRFVGGIRRVGAAKFKRKVTAVGVARFGPGIEAAKEDYNVGFTPFIDELARIEVPERQPRGDPRNLDRVKAIFEALHKKRLAILAAITA